jgi:hypothetical protein
MMHFELPEAFKEEWERDLKRRENSGMIFVIRNSNHFGKIYRFS